jgi:cytochrome c-type biogenesis protein CcmH
VSPSRNSALGFGWAVVAAALAIGIAGSVHAAEPRASLPDIEDEVMCPICGTLLELSDSPQAERERAYIRGLIAQGRDKEQIKDALVAQYGRDVLAVPDSSGFDLSAWLVPVIAFAVALAALILALRRFRRGSAKQSEASELGADDARALERDMSRYDL